MESVTDTCFIFHGFLAANASHPSHSLKTRATVLRFMLCQHLHTLSQRDNQSDLLAETAAPSMMSKTKLRSLAAQKIPSTIRRSEFEADIITHCYRQPGGCLNEAKFILNETRGREFVLNCSQNVCRSRILCKNLLSIIPRPQAILEA